MIHPLCIHRIFIDEQYEGRTNLALCHAECKNHPVTVTTIDTDLSTQTRVQVTSTAKRATSKPAAIQCVLFLLFLQNHRG